MRITVAAICEHAWVEQGCLSIAKIFDTVVAKQFPHVVPRLSIAVRILFRRAEAGAHKLNVMLSDADGKKLMNANMDMTIQVPQASTQEGSYSFSLNGQNISFPQAGDYVVDIVIDGRVEASIPVYVKQSSTPQDQSK